MPSYMIKPATDLAIRWGICMLVYSTPGAGKTTMAASLADSDYGKPLCIVDAEGGAQVVSDRSDIVVVSITDTNTVGTPGFGWERVLDFTNDMISKRLKHADAVYTPQTVVFDNVSEMIEMALKHVVRTIGRSIAAEHRPDQNDWGRATAEILTWVRKVRDFARTSGTNIILIGWELPDKNEQGQVIRNGVLFNPALARKIPGIVDIVGFLRVLNGGKREISFEAALNTDAKFRRNGTEVANQIPLKIQWDGKDNSPLCDVIATLKGGIPFPTTKYLRAAKTPTPATVTAAT